MDKLIVVSVVRDWDMYKRCIQENPFLQDAVFYPIDNRIKNENISVCYNRFLNAYNYSEPAWFVFCHEDFQVHSSYASVLEGADPRSLYGPIGVVTRTHLFFYRQWVLLGKIIESDRTGGSAHEVGRSVALGTPVETFDCQCLITHSSLIFQTKLRFDEQLSFDLYTEDFCIQAKEHFGVASRVLPMQCQHWSHGQKKERYYEQEQYLNTKWPKVCYTGTCSYIIGGGAGFCARMNAWLKHMVRNLIACFIRH